MQKKLNRIKINRKKKQKCNQNYRKEKWPTGREKWASY